MKIFEVMSMEYPEGVCSEVIECEPDFKGIKKATTVTLEEKDSFLSIESFWNHLDCRNNGVIMLQGHNYNRFFPSHGCTWAGEGDTWGGIYRYIDGPIVFTKKQGGKYVSLTDGDVEEIEDFLDNIYSCLYGGYYYVDYTLEEQREEDIHGRPNLNKNS